MAKVGSGYFGSNNLLTSTANQEIIQQNKPSGWGDSLFPTYKISFMNLQDCHIIINNSVAQIYLGANIGFETDSFDKEIYSFVIVESDISYFYIGAY